MVDKEVVDMQEEEDTNYDSQRDGPTTVRTANAFGDWRLGIPIDRLANVDGCLVFR